MKSQWRTLSMVGGILGAAMTGAVVGAVAHGARISEHRRTADDRYAGEPLGHLVTDREYTVAADDGVPLSVGEIDPADGGKPDVTVVFVHGYTLDRRCWYFQSQALAVLTEPRVRQVLYDQRSHGRSDVASTESSTIEQLGRDLDAVIRTAVPDGPIVLIGHSMGGMTIMALAEQRPELFVKRIQSVALIGTSAGDIGRSGLPRPVLSKHNPATRGLGILAAWQPGLVEWARRAGGPLTWSTVRTLAFGDQHVSPSLVDLVQLMINGTSVKAITDFIPTLGSHSRYAALAGLRHCRVLVISGDADRLTPFSHAQAIAAELPDAELVRVPGAGHMVMMERPDLVNEQLIGLVRFFRNSGSVTGKKRQKHA